MIGLPKVEVAWTPWLRSDGTARDVNAAGGGVSLV